VREGYRARGRRRSAGTGRRPRERSKKRAERRDGVRRGIARIGVQGGADGNRDYRRRRMVDPDFTSFLYFTRAVGDALSPAHSSYI